MQAAITAESFLAFLSYFGLGLGLLIAAMAVVTLITPHRDITLIRNGNTAAATAFAGTLVGIALPLQAAIIHSVVPAALAGCDAGPPTGTVLASVDDCRNTDGISLEQCRSAYQDAAKEHERVAPRFASPYECNEQFGNCEARQEGERSYWMPPMTGFLIGYAMGGGFNRNRDGGYGQRTVAGASPLYRDYRSGDYLKPNGDLAGRQPGNVTGARGNANTPARAITVARSGFGSRSGARGSFGG